MKLPPLFSSTLIHFSLRMRNELSCWLKRSAAAQENEWMNKQMKWVCEWFHFSRRAEGIVSLLFGWFVLLVGYGLPSSQWLRRKKTNTNKQTANEAITEASNNAEWTNQLTWVICLCGIEEFMNQWSKTKSGSIEFVNGARGPPPKEQRNGMKINLFLNEFIEWNEARVRGWPASPSIIQLISSIVGQLWPPLLALSLFAFVFLFLC